MRNASQVSQQGMEALVDGVRALAQYARDKALYEADCRIQEELARLRSVIYRRDAGEMTGLTVELNRCKCKVALLQMEIESTPPSVREFLSPLASELETRIDELRAKRRRMV